MKTENSDISFKDKHNHPIAGEREACGICTPADQPKVVYKPIDLLAEANKERNEYLLRAIAAEQQRDELRKQLKRVTTERNNLDRNYACAAEREAKLMQQRDELLAIASKVSRNPNKPEQWFQELCKAIAKAEGRAQ